MNNKIECFICCKPVKEDYDSCNWCKMPLCNSHALKDKIGSPFPFRRFCCNHCIKKTQMNDKMFDNGTHCSKYYEYGFHKPGIHISLQCCNDRDKDTLSHECVNRFKKLGNY